MADATGGAKMNGTTNGVASSYAAKHNIPSHFIGGNELSRAAPSKVKDFVAAQDGHTVITNVSIPTFSAAPSGLEGWIWRAGSSRTELTSSRS